MPNLRLCRRASLLSPDGLAVDDLIEIFRQPVTGTVDGVAVPLGHAFADARDEALALRGGAPVAQRDHPDDLAADPVLALGCARGRVERLVVRVFASPLGVDLGVLDVFVL